MFREYFEPKLEEILKKTYVQGNRIDATFIKLLIEDSEGLGKRLDYVREYVAANTAEVEEQIKPLRDLVSNLLLESVESENSESLRTVLEWYEQEDDSLKRLIKFWPRYDDETKPGNVDNDFRTNNGAMIRACLKNNFEMAMIFFKHHFKLDASQITKVDSNVSHNEQPSKYPLLFRNFEIQRKDEVLIYFRIFKAISKPAYLIAQLRSKIDNEFSEWDDYVDNYDENNPNPIQEDLKFKGTFENEDPVTESFNNIVVARRLAMNHIEYVNKFNSIVKENKEFSVEMLDLCKTTAEAELFIANDFKKLQYFTKAQLDSVLYPRLEVAIQTRNKQFVAHDFCQQILREKLMLSQETGEVLPWNSSNWIEKFIYVIYCTVMLPVFIVCKFGRDISSCLCSSSDMSSRELENMGDDNPSNRKSSWKVLTFFSFPLNRYIAQSISSLVFLGLVTAMVLDENCSFRPYILVFTIAHLFTDMKRASKRISANMTENRFRFWDCYSIATDVLLFVGCILGTLKDHLTQDHLNKLNQDILNQAEACTTGVGVTLAFTKLFYWCQLSSWLGPLAISIKKVFKDIVMVASAYFVFYLAFTVGIHYIMSVPVQPDDNCVDPEESNKFYAFFTKNSSDGALKSAFWSIFDPGHPEYLGCNNGFARTTALTLWGAYQIVNITILINLLVALMNNTMAQINKDKESQWKFYRTEIWLRFINDPSLCAPFNLLEPLLKLVNCRPRKQHAARKQDKNVEKSK